LNQSVWLSCFETNASAYIWELRVDCNDNLDITTATQGVKNYTMCLGFFSHS